MEQSVKSKEEKLSTISIVILVLVALLQLLTHTLEKGFVIGILTAVVGFGGFYAISYVFGYVIVKVRGKETSKYSILNNGIVFAGLGMLLLSLALFLVVAKQIFQGV